MMKTNLLDLNNDILNIIGDYIKQDNIKEQRKIDKEIIFKGIDNNIAFQVRVRVFDSKSINKLLYDIMHDGILTLEECKEYTDTMKNRKIL